MEMSHTAVLGHFFLSFRKSENVTEMWNCTYFRKIGWFSAKKGNGL